MNRRKRCGLAILLISSLLAEVWYVKLKPVQKTVSEYDPDPLSDNQTESELSNHKLKQQVSYWSKKCHQLALHGQGQQMIITGQKKILSRTRKRLLKMLINP